MMATKTLMSDQDYLQRYGNELPDSVTRAKWISTPGDHADRNGQTLVTRSHDVIMRWAGERDAKPAAIAGTEHGNRPGVLRFDFPGGASGGSLQQVTWDQWFETFDDRELVMLFQERMSDGKQSNFFILNNPHREHS